MVVSFEFFVASLSSAVQGCLESVNHAFTANFPFIDLVKAYLCYALLRSCVSPTAAVFQVGDRVFVCLLSFYRHLDVDLDFVITRLCWYCPLSLKYLLRLRSDCLFANSILRPSWRLTKAVESGIILAADVFYQNLALWISWTKVNLPVQFLCLWKVQNR